MTSRIFSLFHTLSIINCLGDFCEVEVEHYEYFTLMHVPEEPYYYCYNAQGFSWCSYKWQHDINITKDFMTSKYVNPWSQAELSVWRMHQTDQSLTPCRLGYRYPFPNNYITEVELRLHEARGKPLF